MEDKFKLINLSSCAAALLAIGIQPYGLEKFAVGDGTLSKLITAKRESDKRNYPTKHEILRNLIILYPNDFFIDSDTGHVYGITHKPTNFRIHLPKKSTPDILKEGYIRELK